MDENNLFIEYILGISFSKPNGWIFLSERTIAEVKQGQILSEGAKEFEEYFGFSKEEVMDFLGQPFCVMTKYDPNDRNKKGMFSPTITVQAALKESVTGIWGIETFEDVIESSINTVAAFLQDFKILREYKVDRIDDKKSYTFDTVYTFEHPELKNLITVEMKSIKIETSNYLFDINCHHSKMANEICKNEIEGFVRSLKLV